jgi:hypothetical protein
LDATTCFGKGRGVEELPCSWDQRVTTDVCLKAEVTDSDERAGQHVKKESANEVRSGERELPIRVAVLSIAILEGDLAVLESKDAVVADGDSMRVSTQVAKDLLGPRHGRLAVDDPISGRGLPQETTPQQGCDSARLSAERPIERVEELSSKHFRKNSNRDQKPWTCGDPSVTSAIQATTGHDAMDMRVEEQRLGPRMKDGNRAGNGSDSALGYGMESFKCRLEEQRVASSSIHKEKRVKGCGHGEDEVEVRYGEELLLLRFHPASLLETLALRTVPVSAGVVERLLPPTLVAHLEVASQERRSTSDDVSDHSTTVTPELFGRRRMSSEDLGQGW